MPLSANSSRGLGGGGAGGVILRHPTPPVDPHGVGMPVHRNTLKIGKAAEGPDHPLWWGGGGRRYKSSGGLEKT